MRRTALVLALASALLLAGAACNGDDEAGSATTTNDSGPATTAAPSTTLAPTTTLSPEDEVLAAYRAANDAINVAFDPPNPNHPDLVAHFSGEALSRVQGRVSQFEGQGVSVIGTLESDPAVLSLAGGSAVVEDCFVAHDQIVDSVTRQPIGDPGEPVVVHVESHLELIDGTWKVVSEQELSDPCTPG